MTFTYSARNPLGTLIQGELDVGTREEAAQQLRRDGFHVFSLEDGDGEGGLFPRRVKRADIIYLTNQLSIMVQTGITLSTALAGIGEQEENPTLKALLLDLKERVETGEDFSAALARHPKYFDRTFIAMIRASEQTGTLGEMLDQVSTYMRREMETRGKVKAALAYPAVMAVLAVNVTIFLLTFILPKFTPLFERKGIKLPLPTVVMMKASHALMDYWYLWLAGAVALILSYVFGRRTDRGRQFLDWCKLHLPILGATFRKVNLSRSIRTLGTMIRSGVSMLDAIALTAEVSGNYYYEQAWRHVQSEITHGCQVCESLRHNPLFPRTLVQMIGAGEETGRLDDVLEKVSDYYDREVETSLKAATSMIEPLMITVMGVVVGGIGMGLLLPIFSLSRAH